MVFKNANQVLTKDYIEYLQQKVKTINNIGCVFYEIDKGVRFALRNLVGDNVKYEGHEAAYFKSLIAKRLR